MIRQLIPLAVLAAATAGASAQRIPRFPIPVSPIAIEGPVRPGAYLGEVGRKAALFGTETGSFEAWAWPLKLVRDLSFAFKIPDDDAPIEAATLASRVLIQPGSKTIVYTHPTFTVRAHFITPLDLPGSLILLDVETVRPIDIIVRMNSDFNLAWPGGFGGQHIGWDPVRKLFHLTQGGIGTYHAAIGSPAAAAGTSHPAHDAPAVPSQFVISVDPVQAQTEFIPIVIAGGVVPADSLWALYATLLATARQSVEAKAAYYEEVRTSLVSVESPDDNLNRAFEWAKVNLDRQRVCNPDLGCGLVAGFGRAGAGNFRPGFGWYFGGDAAINSFAMDLLGQFDLVREGLSFLGTFQRADGKIPHEISQAAGRLPWWTDYPYTWYHGDTTPYWILACVEYWRSSGDRAFIDQVWNKLLLAFRWSARADSDHDGLMENPIAGAGAIEVGGLGNDLHTDIYLAGVWVAALRGLADLAASRGDLALAKEVGDWYLRSHASLEQRFWMDQTGTYAFALLGSTAGTIERNPALTVWPSTAIAFGELEGDHARRMMAQVASSELTTDWGVRMLARSHPLYQPLHYNNGTVWPFVTGFAALGHYQTHRGWAGFDLIRDVAQTTFDFARGSQPELMSGAFYLPLDTAVPDQFFATSMMVTPLLRGLLGIKADAAHCRLELAPQIPAHWDRLSVRHLRTGCGKLSAAIVRSDERMVVDLAPDSLELGPHSGTVVLAPALPLGATAIVVVVDGRSVSYAHASAPPDHQVRLDLTAWQPHHVEIRWRGGAEVVPTDTHPKPGDRSVGVRITDWRQQGGQFVASVESETDGDFVVKVRSPTPLRVIEGGTVISREGEMTTVAVHLAAGTQRGQHLVLAP